MPKVISPARARSWRVAAAAATFVGAAARADACPVCFGASDSPLASGMNAGVFVLLGVTVAVLLAAAATARAVARRARDYEAALTAGGPDTIAAPLPGERT